MKRIVLAVTAVVAGGALLLAGCSSGSSGGGASGGSSLPPAPGPSALASATGVVEITLWHGLGGVAGTSLQSLVDQFNTENTGKIHATAVFQRNYADLLAKYTASLKDSSNPTVIIAGDIATGYLRDVQRSMSPEAMAAANPGELDLGQLRPAARRYYSSNGSLLAVPMNTSTPVLWVNTALLAQAGLPKDVPLTTFDQVAQVATTVKQKTGTAGLVQAFDGWWFEQATAASGALYCTPDNGRGKDGQATAVTYDDPAQVKALSVLAGIYTGGAGLDVGTDGNAALTAFTGGKAAMMLNSSGAAGGIVKAGMTDFEALPYPLAGSASSSGTVVGGSAMWLSSTAADAQKVAGWKLESFLASPSSQETFSQATGYIPINTAVDSSADEQSFLAGHPWGKVFLDQVDSVPDVPATAGCLSGAMTGVRAALVPQMQAVFAGKSTMADGLKAAATAANAAVQQYRDQLGG